jgi:quercetin dioxygenase-like cupin family protein
MGQAQAKVTKLDVRSMDEPDERRTPPKTNVDVVRLEGYTLGRFTFQPGWRWSECVKPVAGTDTCQVNHLGYAVSGRLTVRLDDGTQKSVEGGQSYAIPAGHEAWVEGDRPFVSVEVMSAEEYARPS